jgi:hypothetical protein
MSDKKPVRGDVRLLKFVEVWDEWDSREKTYHGRRTDYPPELQQFDGKNWVAVEIVEVAKKID